MRAWYSQRRSPTVFHVRSATQPPSPPARPGHPAALADDRHRARRARHRGVAAGPAGHLPRSDPGSPVPPRGGGIPRAATQQGLLPDEPGGRPVGRRGSAGHRGRADLPSARRRSLGRAVRRAGRRGGPHAPLRAAQGRDPARPHPDRGRGLDPAPLRPRLVVLADDRLDRGLPRELRVAPHSGAGGSSVDRVPLRHGCSPRTCAHGRKGSTPGDHRTLGPGGAVHGPTRTSTKPIAGMSGNRFLAQAVARQNALRRLVEYRQTLDRERVQAPDGRAPRHHPTALAGRSRIEPAAMLLERHIGGAGREKATPDMPSSVRPRERRPGGVRARGSVMDGQRWQRLPCDGRSRRMVIHLARR